MAARGLPAAPLLPWTRPEAAAAPPRPPPPCRPRRGARPRRRVRRRPARRFRPTHGAACPPGAGKTARRSRRLGRRADSGPAGRPGGGLACMAEGGGEEWKKRRTESVASVVQLTSARGVGHVHRSAVTPRAGGKEAPRHALLVDQTHAGLDLVAVRSIHRRRKIGGCLP